VDHAEEIGREAVQDGKRRRDPLAFSSSCSSSNSSSTGTGSSSYIQRFKSLL